MLNFHFHILSLAEFCSKITFFSKYPSTWPRLTNRLARRLVKINLESQCLQRLSAENPSRQRGHSQFALHPVHKKRLNNAGLQIRVCNGKLVFLFLNQNIGCGYSNKTSQWEGSFENQNLVNIRLN